MAFSPADGQIYRELLGDPEIGRLFGDSAEVRAMLLVEGALALAQGEAGVIPEISARAIDRAAREVQIDPAGLSASTGQSGVPVPALVEAFRDAMSAPEHAQYIHWGATSQDIVDTALTLRLKRVAAILDDRTARLLDALASLAYAHADLPMVARTYGQAATPTTFGAVVSGWGRPVMAARNRLASAAKAACVVSLSGASGTLSVLGDDGSAVRAVLARKLGLGDPGHDWHAERDRIAAFAAGLTSLSTAVGKMGEDLLLLSQTGIDEVALTGGGGSSTMPQKSNPVRPTAMAALARQVCALNVTMQGAALHRQQRDGTAWFTEWMSLPQMCGFTGAAMATALDTAAGLSPNAERMQAALDAGGGLIHAEALTFHLARQLSRPEAQRRVKALCEEARVSGTDLPTLAERDFGEAVRQAFDLARAVGLAPAEARAFAAEARRP